jgi:small multidrug resistance family-3 protein
MHVFSSIAMYVLAAFAEIAGCLALWAWLRLDRSALWLIPGGISLSLVCLPADEG